MANFTVTLSVGVAKGASAVWSYNGSTSGVGTSSGNPLDVQIGDTVTFTRATSSAGTARIRLLNIFTSNADIDLTSSAPTVVRTVASGSTTLDTITGNNQAQSNTDNLYIERQAAASITAPTASSVTFNNPASANTTATVNLSANGSGGTLQYACEVGDTTPDNWQSSSTFTISRGSGTVYAQARRSSTTNSNVVNATRPGFLTGDTSVSATSSTITTSAGNATTTISSGTAGETYAVRLNNGSSNLATRTGNGTVLITSSLPSGGNTTTYEVFVRRPTGTGGDGTTYYPTNDTFTVTRTAADTGAPVITRLGNATVTLDAGGTYSDAGATANDTVDGNITSSIVTVNPVNVNVAGTYTVTYNVSDSAGNAATQVTRSVTVYAVPDITITDVDTITRPNGSTNHSITIAAGSSNTIYEVRTGSVSGTVYGTRTGNGAIPVSSIPSAGTSATYYITGRVTTANGGNNTAVLADTYIVLHEAGASGGSTGGGGTGTYGLRVFDAAGNTTLDVSDRVVTFRERVTGSLSSSQTTKTVTLSGVGTAVINLTPITNIYVGNKPQRQKILYFTISGTSLTIQRTATNAPGSANAAQAYDLLVVYDPE